MKKWQRRAATIIRWRILYMSRPQSSATLVVGFTCMFVLYVIWCSTGGR